MPDTVLHFWVFRKKLVVMAASRRSANPDSVVPRLDGPSVLSIPNRNLFSRNQERDGLRFLRLKVNSREPLQRAIRCLYAAHIFAHVKLGNFIPCSCAGIGHVDGDVNIVFASGRGCLHREMIVAETWCS